MHKSANTKPGPRPKAPNRSQITPQASMIASGAANFRSAKHFPNQRRRAGEKPSQRFIFAIPPVQRPSERLARRNRAESRQQPRHAPRVVLETGKKAAEVVLLKLHHGQIHKPEKRRKLQAESPLARRDHKTGGRN